MYKLDNMWHTALLRLSVQCSSLHVQHQTQCCTSFCTDGDEEKGTAEQGKPLPLAMPTELPPDAFVCKLPPSPPASPAGPLSPPHSLPSPPAAPRVGLGFRLGLGFFTSHAAAPPASPAGLPWAAAPRVALGWPSAPLAAQWGGNSGGLPEAGREANGVSPSLAASHAVGADAGGDAHSWAVRTAARLASAPAAAAAAAHAALANAGTAVIAAGARNTARPVGFTASRGTDAQPCMQARSGAEEGEERFVWPPACPESGAGPRAPAAVPLNVARAALLPAPAAGLL